jgi:RecA/RadA recombinase
MPGPLHYPTGVPVLEHGDCLGLPAGKVVHLIGDVGTGKTTIAIMAAAELVKAGWVTMYVDWTNGLDPDYLKFHGADLDQFAYITPENQLEGLKIAKSGVEEGVHLLVLDGACANVHQLTPQEERIETIKLWAEHFPLLKAAAQKSNTAILVLSRGDRNDTQCGSALKFYADRRILVERGDEHPNIRYSVIKDKYGRADAYGRGKYTLPVPA